MRDAKQPLVLFRQRMVERKVRQKHTGRFVVLIRIILEYCDSNFQADSVKEITSFFNRQ